MQPLTLFFFSGLVYGVCVCVCVCVCGNAWRCAFYVSLVSFLFFWHVFVLLLCLGVPRTQLHC